MNRKKILLIGILILFFNPIIFIDFSGNQSSLFGVVCSKHFDEVTGNDSELSNWWDNDWHYRKQILIYHSQVNDDLYNFPVLISNTSFDFAKHAQLDGDDFVFTTDYGLKLHHEIESYTHTSGELVAWINVPSVSSTEDTIIWLYYGNMNCDNQQNIHGTWNSEYKAVWHLDDNTRTTIKDSTSNNHPGTKKASNEPTEVKGFISKAQNFDGNNDYIKHGDILDEVFTGTNAQFTVSCWMKMTTYSSQACMVGKHGDSNQNENNRE
jgi:biopolymer transport protein ExbB